MKEIIDYKFFLINCIYYYLMNDKNLLWDELNIRKREYSVKENRHKIWRCPLHTFERQPGKKL
ncbi:MAG: hypothetical protein ABSH06_29135 [Thermodesulfobacteriota bacterium]